jgi:hypothetical protein
MIENLSLWNDTPTRQAIQDFVAKVTDKNNDAYVSPEERVAVFDNIVVAQAVVAGKAQAVLAETTRQREKFLPLCANSVILRSKPSQRLVEALDNMGLW